jgi:DNA-binding GntR family transcriptional regulator
MTPPGTFERVYGAIKRRLREGAYKPGDRLEPAVLADQLNSSVTPVRDALHRLTGERLVEAPPHSGFRAPLLTEAMLRHLYDWHLDLLLLALVKHAAAPDAEQPRVDMDSGAPPIAYERQKALFRALVRCTGNPEHLFALASLTERLEAIQHIGETLLDGTEAETAEITRAIEAHDRRGLRRSLVRYHRRRKTIVPELLAKLQQD